MHRDILAPRESSESLFKPVTFSPPPLKLAVICDFLEENWPSMDLNGDMLYHFLAKDHAGEIDATQVRPPLRRRFLRVPLLRQKVAWNADRLVNRFVDYPWWLRRHRSEFNLFHIVDHSYAQLVHDLPPERTIVTCHDLDTFTCLLEPEREKRAGWFRAMARRTLEGLRQAVRVICNSRSTREQLLHYDLFPPERVTVIHSGVHPAFSGPSDGAADAEVTRLFADSSSSGIRILSVGSTIPRKRIDILLRVFASARKEFPDACLVRVGGRFTDEQLQLARELGVERAILVLPFLERNVLAAVYRRVSLLLQPSESEGFGMPLAEAMACGCPVVASDLPVLREVGGAACEYCSVGDIDAWKDTVVNLLRESGRENGMSEFRRREALTQVAQFSWAENVRRTARIYREVLPQ